MNPNESASGGTDVTLTTGRLILRRFTMADVPRVAVICSAPELQRATFLPRPYTVENAADWIGGQEAAWREERDFVFAVVEKESGRLIGAANVLFARAARRADIGYWLAVESWGQGYTTEAMRAILTWFCREKCVHKICGTYLGYNIRSGRVMEKLGLVREAVRPEHIYQDGIYHDLVCCGKILPDGTYPG